MLAEFEQHIDLKLPFLKGKKLLVAISGGIDSVVLAHLLHRTGFEIQLAHCNFRLRGKDADADEQFVIDLAKQLDVEVHTKQFDTVGYAKDYKVSVQMAARQLRYDWFKDVIEKDELDYLVTAHNLDDSLETFLINFTRGTGLEGLTGIPEINDTTARPLLAFSRGQIEVYAKTNGIEWREDVTNAETKYTRNKIRHKVIPLLKEINPSLLDSFQQTIEHLRDSQQIIDNNIINLKKQIVIPAEAGIQKIAIQSIRKLSNPKAYLYYILKDYGFTEWNDVLDLLNAQTGKQLFSDRHRLIKDRDHFLLERLQVKNTQKNFMIKKRQTELSTPEFTIRIGGVKDATISFKDQNTIFVQADKLEFPLELRKWQKGDYFYPFGMKGKKKLSKFFKDEKYSLIDKENAWLLCSKEQIVWVLGKRQDDRFKITDNTKKIVQIDYVKA